MGLDNFIYQHDNDPKHTSKLVKEFFINKNRPILDCPSQSPDLNPIEHIWAYMKNQLRRNNFNNEDKLNEGLIRVMNNMSHNFIIKLIHNIPKKFIQVIKFK